MQEPSRGHAESVGEHRAGRPVEVVRGHQAEVEQPTAAEHVVEDPLLDAGRQVLPARQCQDLARLWSTSLEVDRAEAEAGHPQRSRQGPARSRTAVQGQVVDHVGHQLGAGVVVLGCVGVQHEAEHEIVMLLAASTPATAPAR